MRGGLFFFLDGDEYVDEYACYEITSLEFPVVAVLGFLCLCGTTFPRLITPLRLDVSFLCLYLMLVSRLPWLCIMGGRECHHAQGSSGGGAGEGGSPTYLNYVEYLYHNGWIMSTRLGLSVSLGNARLAIASNLIFTVIDILVQSLAFH